MNSFEEKMISNGLKAPLFKMILTSHGACYKTEDGIFVVPITCLKNWFCMSTRFAPSGALYQSWCADTFKNRKLIQSVNGRFFFILPIFPYL